MWQETVSPSVSNRTIVLLYKINMLPLWGGGGGGGGGVFSPPPPQPPSESSKEVTSGSPGQVYFLARQVTFTAFLPDVQGNKQVILLISKMGELLDQRTSCNSSPFSSSAPPLILGS